MRPIRFTALLVACLIGCSGGGGGGDGGATVNPTVQFAAAFGGETFSRPLLLIQHPADDDRWYVVEQRGKIFTFLASNPAGTRALVVDVEALFDLGTASEEGLLGMAFDPGFAMNGEVFLSYTESLPGGVDSVLARYTSPDDGLTLVPAAADPTVMAVDQPFGNHNGGDIRFGSDGLLYWALGDGGSGNDPLENGQDVTTLLGSILRIDPSTTPPGIPADNPFVGSAGADEIYAFGLRNPWRMSFDSMTGELWAGDVGQGRQEEIDRIVKGGNYGWDCLEGSLPLEMDANCEPAPIPPEVEHSQPEFQSITGGYVYRGTALPALQGAYVYGDFITGRINAFYFNENPTRVVALSSPPGVNPSSFGQDRDGEIYVLDLSGTPSIYKLVPTP